MSKTPRKRKYSGALAEPIRYKQHRSTIIGMTPEEAGNANGRELLKISGIALEKMGLLFEHYKIERGNFALLALALATEFIPGFRLDPDDKRGRPKTRNDPMQLMALLADVERVKHEKSAARKTCTDSHAIKILTTTARYSTKWGPDTDERRRTLKNWLPKARNKATNPLYWMWEMCERMPDPWSHKEKLIPVFSITENQN